jgi:micrococcal nuclease
VRPRGNAGVRLLVSLVAFAAMAIWRVGVEPRQQQNREDDARQALPTTGAAERTRRDPAATTRSPATKGRQRKTAAPGKFTGRVVGVSDGDTLTVLRDKTPVKVRLWGVDAPEKSQAFGQQAKKRTSALAFGETVTVLPEDVDRYGRTVARVVLPDGRSLNWVLVAEGYAWWYRAYARDETLAKAEAAAQHERLGLWGAKTPEPPWEFRKHERERRQKQPATRR